MQNFGLAKRLSDSHLIVQPADLRLNPPESYLYIQDGLIIACGVLYALCYAFYMIRTYKDKTLAGPVEFLCGTMAYEIFYAWTTTSTTFERVCFFVWFLMDASFAEVAVYSAYPPAERGATSRRLVIGTLLGVAFLYGLCQVYPDEREQVTGYWTGALLEMPIGWGQIYYLLRRGDTKGQSLEIWMTRFLGCVAAFAVFVWRYLNVPSTWSYVGSFWSIVVMVLTIAPEIAYPAVYVYVHAKQKTKHE